MKKLTLLPLLLLSLAAHADEREWVPYKKLIDELRLDKFYAIPAAERDKLNMYITVKPRNAAYKPADVVLTVVHGSERQVLTPLSADYRMTVVPNPKWLTDDTKIMTSLPKEEKSKVDYEVTTPLPEGTQWNYTPVMSSVAQMNQVIKKMAGALSMFAPSAKAVVFKFSKPAQLKVGEMAYTTDARNQIRLKPESAWLKENPLMVASERPIEARLDSE
ncbi:DUF2987 domain-containing protein [Duganella sp. BJB488]|uniref:DUF2987 domain-containing protein n=1 Tax=unclassified Duganella TaxID=2636909 RepID=UPI000E347E22|nr:MULTISPECIES: DUF2987 domain-containing protein [unclassified Duganella]RFP10514.1 DUF2987 domain-containing protein [Duganella sp. BJB489]RFP14226.1 DUF2987 domain-containing protein [Duganella sp. BJB488]RFP30163.1 DUF2987 domain-containing protein [Duganella sp. BJB480]